MNGEQWSIGLLDQDGEKWDFQVNARDKKHAVQIATMHVGNNGRTSTVRYCRKVKSKKKLSSA